MTEQLLARAQTGDGDAFAELVRPFRAELQLHCYRILGSAADAEDAMQEALMAAWRGLDQFQGRSSVRAWLYRIATNKSLNAMRGSIPPPRHEAANRLPEPTRHSEPSWLEPYPDVLLDEIPDRDPGPEARYEAREAVSLAFVAAVQHLPPMQRAALIVRDVLGFRAAEAAEILECSVDAVNGLLKRARANIARELPPGGRERSPLPGSARERDIVARFTDAYERGDTGAIVALLTDDATLTMPPLPFVYQGRVVVGDFLAAICASRRFRLIPTRANGQPAFGCYLDDDTAPTARAHGLIVLTLAGGRIAEITRFFDNSILPPFGLPRSLPCGSGYQGDSGPGPGGSLLPKARPPAVRVEVVYPQLFGRPGRHRGRTGDRGRYAEPVEWAPHRVRRPDPSVRRHRVTGAGRRRLRYGQYGAARGLCLRERQGVGLPGTVVLVRRCGDRPGGFSAGGPELG